jgi:hypothetical protein
MPHKLKLVLVLAFQFMMSCVSENQTYLTACPHPNMSTQYPEVKIIQGHIRNVGVNSVYYRYNLTGEFLPADCEWIAANDELLYATPYSVQKYGEFIWNSKLYVESLKAVDW